VQTNVTWTEYQLRTICWNLKVSKVTNTTVTSAIFVSSDISDEGPSGLFYPLFYDSLQFLFRADELFGEFAGHSSSWLSTRSCKVLMSQASGWPRSVYTPENINTVQDLVLSQENAPQTHRTTRQIERSNRCCQIFGVCQGTSSYSSRTAHLHTVHGTPSSCYDTKPQTSLDQMCGQRIHQTSIQLTIGSGGWYKNASIRQRFGISMIWSSALPVSGLSWSKASLIKPLNSGGQGWELAFAQRDNTEQLLNWTLHFLV